MQNYELHNGEYSQEDMLQFDKDKLVKEQLTISQNNPEFLKERAREEIKRLTRDIEERTNLILNK